MTEEELLDMAKQRQTERRLIELIHEYEHDLKVNGVPGHDTTRGQQ